MINLQEYVLSFLFMENIRAYSYKVQRLIFSINFVAYNVKIF